MGAGTKIEWATDTFNPWIGCEKVSPGCTNCYAEAWALRYGRAQWGPNVPRPLTSDSNWNEPVKWNREAQTDGEKRRVFCASLADVFEDRRDIDEYRARLWKLIAKTPFLTWLLLTKRPDKIAELVPKEWMNGLWPTTVWAGTTAENDEWLERRAPHLLQLPAPQLFISAEPLLGPLESLYKYLRPCDCLIPAQDGLGQHAPSCAVFKRKITWVIAGGESGQKFRPMNELWVRDIMWKCRDADIPFFYKQTAARFPNKAPLLDGVRFAQTP